MQIEILTEESNTTTDRDSVDQVFDLFQGGFLQVKNLASQLSSYGDISTHIFSKRYGYLQGSNLTAELTVDKGDTGPIQEFSQAVSEASKRGDVVVILLTTSVFKKAVTYQWDELVSNANSDSVWFIGASRSALESVDINKMRFKSSRVISYERVGVARISSEHKNKLVNIVNKKASN